MICPVYTNLTVRDLFNEIVTALGGQALTEDEFRDSALRSQRTGSDFAAMEAAYRIWNRNNGNPIDCTPNTKELTSSILFQSLLDYYNGDRASAIRAKSQIYTKSFIEKFGNWNNAENTSDTINNAAVDVNGEPLMSSLKLQKRKSNTDNTALLIAEKLGNPFEMMDYNKIFGDDIVQRLNNGEIVSSKDIVEYGMTLPNFFHGRLSELSKVLALHDVPVMLSLNTNTVYSTTVSDKYGGAVILINRNRLNGVSKMYAGEAILHELVHAITTKALTNPKTESQKVFKRSTEKIFKAITGNMSDTRTVLFTTTGSFALANTREFVSEFLTNDATRESIYSIAKEIDNLKPGVIQMLKNFVNKLFKLFVNKELFNTKSNLQEQLKQYETYLKNYINNEAPIQRGNILSKSVLNGLYDSINREALANDLVDAAYNELNKFVTTDNISLVNFKWNIGKDSEQKDIPVNDRYEHIMNALLSRINSLKASTLNSGFKQTLITETENQLNQFKNPKVTKYEAISNFMKMLQPRLKDTIDELRKIEQDYDKSSNPTTYMFQMHSNVGMFETVVTELSIIVTNEQECNNIVEQFNKQSEENNITADDVKKLLGSLDNMSSVIKSCLIICNTLLNRSAIKTMQDVVKEAGALEGAEYLNNLGNVSSEEDINWFATFFGQADASSNEIIRAVSHMIDNTNHIVDEKVKDKAITLLQLLSKLNKGESVLDLYEFADGAPTQNLVRDRNFGKFYKEKRKMLAKLNDKYGLPELNTMPPANSKDRVGWNKEYNKWLEDNAERRYLPKYYSLWGSISAETKQSLDKINGAMFAILAKYDTFDENGVKHSITDEDGVTHFDLITDEEDFLNYQQLVQEKKLLRNKHDRFGNKKEGRELEEAELLADVYKKLYGENFEERKKLDSKWRAARDEVIEKCGGQLLYELFLNGEPNNFDFKTLDKWDSRNSKWLLKKDERGKTVFDIIEDALQGLTIDYGEEYKKLKEYEKDLLSTAYDMAGEINPNLLSLRVKNTLKNEVYPRLAEIKREVLLSIPGYAELNAKYSDLLGQYVTYVDTRYYKEIKDLISNDIYETFGAELDKYMPLYLAGDYGTMYEVIPGEFGVAPYKWLQRIEAKDKQYMELVPNDAWQDRSLEKRFDNPIWSSLNLDLYGEALVPKKELYDNSKQWNKIKNSKTLTALYNEVVRTMDESNKLQTNRSWTNTYQLPGVSYTLLERFGRTKWYKWLGVLLKWVGEKIGIKRWQDQDAILSGQTTVNDNMTEEGDEIRSNFTRVIGTYPDGTPYSSLPQYYTRKLDNPENISFNLIDMVLSYYKMSVNYSEKNKIKDACETMLDFVKSRKYSPDKVSEISSNVKKGALIIVRGASSAEQSNTYKMLKSTLDLGLYQKKLVNIETKWFSFSVLLSTVRELTSATNLGWNRKVAVVGFLTAMHAHTLNALVGKEYKFKDLVRSAIEVAKSISYKTLRYGPYSNLSEDKLLVIMESFNLAGQLDKKITNTNMNQIARMIYQNHTYGYLATVDYLTKSQIAVATLKNYRYIDGEIYSSLDIDYMLHDKLKYNNLRSKYANAKSIYDLIEVKDGKIHFSDSGVRSAWNNRKNAIKSKCIKQAEKADGVATGLQRAAIQQSWIGIFLMIHRQFLPLMLNERLGQRVYDYDTQEYKNGQFRTLYKYVTELMLNSLAFGVLGGSLALTPFLGPLFGIGLGTAAAIGFRSYGKAKHVRDGVRDMSFKEINEAFFGNFKDQKSTIVSTENKYAMRLIIIENVMQLLMSYLVVQPLCDYADDDKDNYFLQCLAYWLKASQWEIGAPYNIEDIFSNVKSPTAATSILDKFTNINSSWTGAFLDVLYLLSLSDEKSPIVGHNSPYEGMPRWLKDVFQLSSPLHNEFEQSQSVGVRGKRKYIERQMFHEKAGDNFNIYKFFYENK